MLNQAYSGYINKECLLKICFDFKIEKKELLKIFKTHFTMTKLAK